MEEKHFGPVWFIPGLNKAKYPYCHSVYLEGAGVLIDPCSDRQRLQQLKDRPGVKEVWLSHWHEDHIGGLDLFEDVPFIIHEKETAPLADLETFLDWYGLTEEHKVYWRDIMVKQFHYKTRKPARTFKGGEKIEAGGVEIEVIPAPGHTPGSLAFFFKGPDVLFMGDYDLSKFGPWYGDRDSSIDDTIASVNRLRQVPAKVWIPGHEDGLHESPPGDAFDRYLAVIDDREAKLLSYLSEPRSMEDIVNQWIVYRKPREPKGFFEFGERALMGKHLERLMGSGAVEAEDGRYRKK